MLASMVFNTLCLAKFVHTAIVYRKTKALAIPVWYTNKITIIDFDIYTQLFLVKLKRVVDGLFQYGILIKLPS